MVGVLFAISGYIEPWYIEFIVLCAIWTIKSLEHRNIYHYMSFHITIFISGTCTALQMVWFHTFCLFGVISQQACTKAPEQDRDRSRYRPYHHWSTYVIIIFIWNSKISISLSFFVCIYAILSFIWLFIYMIFLIHSFIHHISRNNMSSCGICSFVHTFIDYLYYLRGIGLKQLKQRG